MAKTDAPNYRSAGPATTQKCATCRYATANSARDNWCSLYQFQFDPDAVCDSWRPNVAAVREARQALAQAAEEKTVKEARSIIGRAGRALLDGALTTAGALAVVGAIKEYMAHGNGGLLSPAGLRRAIASAMLGPWDEEDEEEPGEETTKKATGSILVFKDTAGRDRWVTVSSSAYQDQDREIVSQRALNLAVAIGDHTKERGPLRWWHVPPLDLGDCDFQMTHGRMLIESGTFRNSRIAAKVAKAAPGLQVSIGFRHPPNEPQAGVYDNIVIFERSLVPAGLASNRFTALHVIAKENDNMATKEKLAAFRALLGPEADAILAGVETTDKAAQEAGVAFKERTTAELSQMTAAELLDYALTKMEKEAATPEPTPAPEPAPAAEPEPVAATKEAEPAPVADALTATEFQATMKAFAEAIGVSLKEVAQQAAKPDPAVAQVQQQIADLTGKLKEAEDALAALTDEQPRALKSGYRASVQGEPVEDPQANAEAMAAASKAARTNGNHWGEFEDIAARLNPWNGAQQ